MALCFDHPLCYRNNSTTIKKYGYNSKPSINGAKFVTVKYGSGTDKRYYLCESSSATSGNKLATVSGNKYYVNNGYVDVEIPVLWMKLPTNHVWIALMGYSVSNGGLKDSSITVGVVRLHTSNGDYSPYQTQSVTIPANSTFSDTDVDFARFSNVKGDVEYIRYSFTYKMNGVINTGYVNTNEVAVYNLRP